MNKDIIKAELHSLLEAIHEQIEVLRETEEKIPQIEFDIILENIRKLYENVHILQRLNDPYDHVEKRLKEPPSRPAESFPAPEEKKTPKKSAKPADTDLFAEEQPTFNIKLKEARDKSLGPKVPPNRIDNLKTAITINEKFMFINELFEGSLREYNESIEALNGFTNLNQAAEYLDRLKKKNFWNTGSEAFKKLTELIERRY